MQSRIKRLPIPKRDSKNNIILFKDESYANALQYEADLFEKVAINTPVSPATQDTPQFPYTPVINTNNLLFLSCSSI